MAKYLHDPAAMLPPRRRSINVDCAWTASGISHRLPPMYNLREAGSSTGLLIYSTLGTGFFRSLDRKWVLAEAGDLFYYEPKAFQEYGDLLTPGWEYHWVHFPPKPQWKNWLRFIGTRGIPGLSQASISSKRDRAEVLALFRRIHQHLRYGGPWRQERALNLVEAILLLANQEAGESLPDDRIRAALETIAEDPAKKISVPALARDSGLSPSRFSHLFKRETGSSVMQTVLQSKLNEARNLLANSSKSVSEIAAALNLSSGEYLSYLFKRRFGLPPSRFRRKRSSSGPRESRD